MTAFYRWLAGFSLVLTTAAAWAQGRRGRGGPFGSSSPEERAQRYESFLKRMDANGDGMLSPEELGPRKEFFNSMPKGRA